MLYAHRAGKKFHGDGYQNCICEDPAPSTAACTQRGSDGNRNYWLPCRLPTLAAHDAWLPDLQITARLTNKTDERSQQPKQIVQVTAVVAVAAALVRRQFTHQLPRWCPSRQDEQLLDSLNVQSAFSI